MAVSLIDELDATLRELDELAERWEQLQTYDRALMRMRYLAPKFALLIEEIKRMQATVPNSMWSHLQKVCMRERPQEVEAIERALVAEDEPFAQLVSYLGFVRGGLAVLADAAMAHE